MNAETISITRTVAAPADAVFTVLADPANHATIDGTGWVCEPLDGEPLTRPGQVFRMGMYHANHPDGRYEIANQVRELDRPRAISWQPGTEDAEGRLSFGGWVWRYDLAPTAGGGTQIRLTYDWSAATAQAREVIVFPPFGTDHLTNSLRHLAALATLRKGPADHARGQRRRFSCVPCIDPARPGSVTLKVVYNGVPCPASDRL